MHIFISCKKHLQSSNNRWKTVRGDGPTRYPLSVHFDSILCKKKKTKFTKQKKWEKIIKVLYQNHMHIFIPCWKTSAMFQNNLWKTVRGVAPTRYPLSIHIDSISYRKQTKFTKQKKCIKKKRRIISKPHAHLHSMQKTSEKFQNNLWKTVRGVAPTRYPVYFHLKGQLNLEIP